MKVFNPLAVASASALCFLVAADPSGLRGVPDHRRLTGNVTFPSGLTNISNSDSYHMKTVRVVQARVQSDKPVWNADNMVFVSKYGASFSEMFRGVLDTVNTASVEGALMYVQAEGINYLNRGTSDEDRCKRKNNMKYIVLYDMVLTQTNETLALYGKEYGKYLSMDSGQCTPTSVSGDTSVFPEECYMFNGTSGRANVGPFVGGEARDTDERAPYPNTWWYSFPNTCAMQKWGSAKTDSCRQYSRGGLCDYDTRPDGIKCTYNYRIIGWVPIDDLVGITPTHANFSAFCMDGGVEFNGTTNNTWIDGIDFWRNPRDSTANAARASALVAMYNNAIAGTVNMTQVDSSDLAHFAPLPTIADLRAQNPPCYFNVAQCATAPYGCRRDLFGQICTVCTGTAAECVVAPTGFTFPTLVQATAPPSTTAPTPTTTTPTTTTPTPTSTTASPKTSSASGLSLLSVATMVSIVGLSYLL